MSEKVIYKYILEEESRQIVKMPLEAVVRKAAVQGDDICIWAEVNPYDVIISRVFWLFGTGQDFEDRDTLVYVDTVFRGRFVWHIYEDVA